MKERGKERRERERERERETVEPAFHSFYICHSFKHVCSFCEYSYIYIYDISEKWWRLMNTNSTVPLSYFEIVFQVVWKITLKSILRSILDEKYKYYDCNISLVSHTNTITTKLQFITFLYLFYILYWICYKRTIQVLMSGTRSYKPWKTNMKLIIRLYI